MFLNYPVEVSLLVLSNLSFSQLRCIHLVCRSWNAFIKVNEASVYRNAAFEAGFIASHDESLFNAKGYARKAFRDVTGWKDYCRRRLGMELGWAGKAHSVIKSYQKTAEDIYQFKVDEARGFAITTSLRTGLVVTHLEEDRVLWGLQRSYAPDIRLCEFDHEKGYLAFDRPDGSIDIWQHIQNVNPDEPDSVMPPTGDQLKAAADSVKMFGPTALGHFKPSSNLPAEDTDPQVLRLVYPHLVVATFARIHVWNVTNGKLLQIIDLSAQSQFHDLWVLQNVEISDRYIIASLKKGILVFSLEDGSYLRTIPLILQKPDPPRFTVVACEPSPFLEGEATKACLVPRDLQTDDQRLVSSEIIAGRVWNNTFAVVMNMGNIYIIDKFEQVVSGELPVSEAIINIQIPSSALSYPTFLDFRQDRIAIAYSSSSQAVYILSLRHALSIPESGTQSGFSNITVSRTRPLKNMTPGDHHRGIQLTEGGIYFLSRCKPDHLELGDDVKEPVIPATRNTQPNLFHLSELHTQVPVYNSTFQWQQMLQLSGGPITMQTHLPWLHIGSIPEIQPAQTEEDASSDVHSDEDTSWLDDDPGYTLVNPSFDSLPELITYSDYGTDDDDHWYPYRSSPSHLFYINVAPEL